MNKTIGVDGGGVNAIRHMKVTSVLDNPEVTDQERLKLSRDMGHSLAMQGEYQRQNEKPKKKRKKRKAN